MFVDLKHWPAAADLVERITADLKPMQEHYRTVSKDFTVWPEPLHGGGWDVFAFKWQGYLSGQTHWDWLRSRLVLNAGYSRLAPGTIITPHKGYTGDVLRLHVGIDCPEGDCALQVGSEVRGWRNGEALLFDDTVQHQAWNKTGSERVVLLLDLVKPKGFKCS